MESKLHYLVKDLKAILKDKKEDKEKVKGEFSFSKDNLDTCNVEVEIELIVPKEIVGIPKQPIEYHVKLKYEIYHRTFLGESVYKGEEIEELFIKLSKDFEKFENM